MKAWLEMQNKARLGSRLCLSGICVAQLSFAAPLLATEKVATEKRATEKLKAEHDFAAVIDMRLTHTSGASSDTSHTNAGLGKYRFDPGNQLSLAQAGLSYTLDWDNPFSAHLIANAYVDQSNPSLGITEGFIKYRSLPSQSGLRAQAKLGLMYPTISLENIATAWASPYTLSYSAINSWLGEELRHVGAEFTLEKLGKFTNSKHSFTLSGAAFKNNDTAGALLAWHGWTNSSKQTLLQQHVKLSKMPSLDGSLSGQARSSDPFIELDNRFGYHVHGQWQYRGYGKLTAGYYDNNADTSIVINGQYTWLTRFSHLGIKWRLPYKIELLSQYMNGSTLMSAPDGTDAVNNDYQSGYIMLSRRWGVQRLSVRAEQFSVTDNDLTPDDDNHEQGHGFTASYQYRMNKNWFIHGEYNHLYSERPARSAQALPSKLTENQYQLAMRWFF
ncbi:hypothetical protein [Shewanella maritima]|uniref:hypothetical protein n=1 Tax=Shewanella maritima TaxID=2520507 RepID=UPI001A91919A|nr:hypothetical protein [Shewanella maritima]